jgi:ornithine carbamoyltransferase
MMDLLKYTPQQPFSQKHLLTLGDYTPDEINQVLCLALKLKDETKRGIPHPLLAGKALGMIFTKSSTRTRVSFEVGINQLGGYGLFLGKQDIQMGRGETVHDTAKVLSRYVDGIMIRTYAQQDVTDLARYGSIPVINGLTDMYHPCQVLTDLMTVYESKGTLAGLKLAFVGDGHNMAHSLLLGCAKAGMTVAVATPEGYSPDPAIIAKAEAAAEESGGGVLVTTDIKEAAKDADVIYTDVWASMGQEEEQTRRLELFRAYQVDAGLMKLAKPDAVFLHCLPAHRGEEVTAEVIDGPQSLVFDEAENRLHAQKAVMVLLMAGMEAKETLWK